MVPSFRLIWQPHYNVDTEWVLCLILYVPSEPSELGHFPRYRPYSNFRVQILHTVGFERADVDLLNTTRRNTNSRLQKRKRPYCYKGMTYRAFILQWNCRCKVRVRREGCLWMRQWCCYSFVSVDREVMKVTVRNSFRIGTRMGKEGKEKRMEKRKRKRNNGVHRWEGTRPREKEVCTVGILSSEKVQS